MQAAEAFTNRSSQWETVAAALTEHLQHVSSLDPEDLEAPRNNVLVFHGVGGIGKTTLSRTLEAALADAGRRPSQWGAPGWPADRILPVRIDLARSAGTDFEQIVLTIRSALTRIGRPLPAFDLALRRYWDVNHPGEPLEEYLRRAGLGSRFGQALPQQVQSALADVAQALMLPGTIGSVVGQVTGALVSALRERRQTVRALAGCARLADLLEAEPDLDALAFYPHLLAWELTRLPEGKRVVPVILLDTFEDIGDRTHRDLERLIQRTVWLMPNAFWIITSRSRLQWADPALQGQLDYTGPSAWPGLSSTPVPAARAPGVRAARQVLVGDFSPEDCDDYLARRLTRDGQPLISESVRQVITARSYGLPLHLDLSVARFLELRRTGHLPQPADFDHDFPALVARTLSDLTPDERRVLRSVTLLDAFDIALATRAAGLTHESPAQRLTERPFVRETPFGLWPFHLHSLIQSAVRTADDTTDDRWTETDWHQAAQRAFTALGEQHQAADDPGRLLLIACLRQGLRLARDHHLDLDWLTPAAWTYVSDSVWEPLAPPARQEQAGTLHTPAEALAELLHTLARRQHEHRARTVERLTTVIDAGLLPGELQEMAVYYQAKAERDLGRSNTSRHGMQYVADRGGRLAPAARRGLAHLARLGGDFPTALATARALGWAGRGHRVEGDIWWPHGDMHRAATAYAAARAQAEEHAVAGELATSQAQRAFVLSFTDPRTAADEIDLARQLLTGLVLRVTTATVATAELIRDASTTHDIEDRAEQLRTEIRLAGVTVAEPILELALSFHHAIQGDDEKATASITRLRELTHSGDYAYYADIAHFMAGLPVETPSQAQWLDGAQPTRQRWRNLVIARRELL
ncbi:ATP/GTP-binding protein [Streptomyces sp. NPDC002742]|uniref:ATP/GTP-binding protein n=1 Tax=Streptomyces sp. NPDC002742 TaxID=3364663 RepID=UPI003686B332